MGGRGKKWDDLFNSEPKICFNLTIKDLFISESCIEIKIELNFFTLSRIGTLRVKNEFLNWADFLNADSEAMIFGETDGLLFDLKVPGLHGSCNSLSTPIKSKIKFKESGKFTQ